MKKNKNRHNSQQGSINATYEREDKLELNGTIEEALPGTWFKVIVDNGGGNVLATLSGKLRTNNILLIPGDRVTVAVSPYDLSRGRVVWRF